MARSEYIRGTTVRKPNRVHDRQPYHVHENTRRHKRHNMSLGYLLFLSLAMVLMLGTLAWYISLQSQVKNSVKNIATLESQLNNLKQDNDEAYNRANGNVDLEEVKRIASLCNISFIRQKEILGLGHAVLQAKTFAGGDPVAVLYGDDVIMSERKPVCRQLIDAYETYGKGVVGVKEVSTEQILKYCSLAVEKIKDNIYTCSDMIEKPRKEEILSHFAILGRCVLPPEIFQLLEETQPGAGGEIQLTDAMARLCRSEGMIAVDFDGKRYDMGNKLGIMEAAVETALRHPEIGKEFREYLKNLVSSIDFS